MKTIIAGSRDFRNYAAVEKAVAYVQPDWVITEIVSGMARGADTLGERWARNHTLPVKQFPAEWDRYGKSAGYKRNHQMAQYGNILIAFWDGQSRGTLHMIQIATQMGLRVYVFDFNGNLFINQEK